MRDELGDWRLVVLTPFGGRVHAPWTLALEARGFGRPGRRTLLREPRDSGAQRVARWAMVAALPVLAAVRAAVGLP